VEEATRERGILEALIFASEQPAKLATLRRAVPGLSAVALREHVAEINRALSEEGRPYEIAEIAGGYQFRTRPCFAEALRDVQPERRLRLSRAALECLAVVAYRQPITRAEIDAVRGVDSGASLRNLLERDLLRVVGRRDAPGRPALYGTSAQFLELFGLGSLRDLPELRVLDPPPEQEGTEASAHEEEPDAPDEGDSEADTGEPGPGDEETTNA
jgi:segregation and condensation protein B